MVALGRKRKEGKVWEVGRRWWGGGGRREEEQEEKEIMCGCGRMEAPSWWFVDCWFEKVKLVQSLKVIVGKGNHGVHASITHFYDVFSPYYSVFLLLFHLLNSLPFASTCIYRGFLYAVLNFISAVWISAGSHGVKPSPAPTKQ